MQTLLATQEQEQHLIQKKQEIALLEQEAKFDAFVRNALIIGLIIIGLLAYLVVSRQRLKIKKNKELLEKNKQLYLSKQALANVELENSRLKEKELQQELEYKNKELTSYTINFIQKSELMEELKENISELKKTSGGDTLTGKLNNLKKLVDSSFSIDKDWEDFRLHFEQVHQDFFKLLKDRCPELSNSELKLCALIKLNLSMKETATILGISPESVKTARYRLRKKLQLSHEENLIDFILDTDQKAVESALN
jgi:DNA-binding CsgD family transcriptional regulator/type II secretory pathway pseudopilin PulG